MPPKQDFGSTTAKSVRELTSSRARVLRSLPHSGTFIALRQVPHAQRRRWEARLGPLVSLYKIDLPEGWRALYTTSTDESLRLVLVFEVVPHKEYDRLLGYG